MLYILSDLLTRRPPGTDAKTAIVDGTRRISYFELTDRAQRYALLLREAGIRRGDRVGIFMRRSIESVIALFAVAFAEGVAVFLNDVLKSMQANYILQHCGASLLLTESRLLLSVPDLAMAADRIIEIDKTPAPEDSYAPTSTIGEDVAMIIYTSGSTGRPKGITLSHTNLLGGAHIISDYLRISGDDILISLLPFSFDYGLNQLLTALLKGGTLVIQRSLFPADICKTLLMENVSGMAAVPMLWLQLTQEYSPFLKTGFPKLRYMTNTGGRLPEGTVRLLRKAHPGADLYLMYGLTEAFRSTFLPPDQADRRPTSIGKAIPNVEILVLNEQGKPCAPGEVGELVHRGANISLGYWRDPESSAKVFRQNPLQNREQLVRPETVVYSGDWVKQDEEGYLYYVGRKDQTLKSHGIRVSSEEVEEYIFASQLVSGAVVFGVPREDAEPELVAVIVPKDPATFRLENLLQFCKKEMPEYLRPHKFSCMKSFPQTSSGKPDRVRIKEDYAENR